MQHDFILYMTANLVLVSCQADTCNEVLISNIHYT